MTLTGNPSKGVNPSLVQTVSQSYPTWGECLILYGGEPLKQILRPDKKDESKHWKVHFNTLSFIPGDSYRFGKFNPDSSFPSYIWG